MTPADVIAQEETIPQTIMTAAKAASAGQWLGAGSRSGCGLVQPGGIGTSGTMVTGSTTGRTYGSVVGSGAGITGARGLRGPATSSPNSE